MKRRRPTYPRVVFEGTCPYTRDRFRIVETSGNQFVAEQRHRDQAHGPRWELVDFEVKYGRDACRGVVRLFGQIAAAKRRRLWRR